MTVRFRPRLSASQRWETGAAAVSSAIRTARWPGGLLPGRRLGTDDVEDAEVAPQQEAGDVGERGRQRRSLGAVEHGHPRNASPYVNR